MSGPPGSNSGTGYAASSDYNGQQMSGLPGSNSGTGYAASGDYLSLIHI